MIAPGKDDGTKKTVKKDKDRLVRAELAERTKGFCKGTLVPLFVLLHTLAIKTRDLL